jgi:isoquinoline 1-oxidoreductase beta subunit
MGQGPTTACSQLLAEELECDWSKVRMQFAPVDPASFGHQTTVGSQAIRSTWEPLRRAGAEAREMLKQAAAQQWGVDKSQCRAENGFVVNASTGARLSYGSLADAAAKLPVPQNVALKDPKQFRVIGKPVKRLDTREKVTGRAQYGLDARVPGMVYAVIQRCPVFGGKVASFDASKAKAVPGVKDVMQISRGVAVIADNTWAAMQGRRALTVQWDEGAGASVSSATIRQMFADRAKQQGAVARKEGDVAFQVREKLLLLRDVPFGEDGFGGGDVLFSFGMIAAASGNAGLGVLPTKIPEIHASRSDVGLLEAEFVAELIPVFGGIQIRGGIFG